MFESFRFEMHIYERSTEEVDALKKFIIAQITQVYQGIATVT